MALLRKLAIYNKKKTQLSLVFKIIKKKYRRISHTTIFKPRQLLYYRYIVIGLNPSHHQKLGNKISADDWIIIGTT